MQNLPEKENLTDSMCGLCHHSPIIYPSIMPYFLISLPMNSWVLWLMKSSPVFWTDRMEVSEFHLVLSEILSGFLGPPLLTITHFCSSNVADTLYKVVNTVLLARIQFQSCVCIERYLAVVQPVLFLRLKPLRYRMSLCCFIWLQTNLIGIVQMFFCSEDIQIVSIYTGYFLLVLIVNSFCCVSVLRALKQPSPGEGEREKSNLIKKRAFNIVLMFQVTTIIGYLPLISILLIYEDLDWSTLCFWQPLAYCIMIWLGAIYPLLHLRRAWKNLPVVRNVFCVKFFQE